MLGAALRGCVRNNGKHANINANTERRPHLALRYPMPWHWRSAPYTTDDQQRTNCCCCPAVPICPYATRCEQCPIE